MIFPPILLRIAGLPATALIALNRLPEKNISITEEEWNLIYFNTLSQLCELSRNPNLLNGLRMTSHSLAGRVEKIIEELPPILRKKEKQSARSLWQIASRMAGKISPFSSFTHLGRVDANELNTGTVSHRFRLNNILLGQFLEILRYHPPFFQNQKIKLNYTAELVGTEYVFLHNTRNVESVQRIEEQPVIGLIIQFLKNEETIVFKELVEMVLSEVEAEKDEIIEYIFTLTEYGLLVWVLPVAPSAEYWWKSLEKELHLFRDDHLCGNLERILSEAEDILSKLSTKTPIERGLVQQEYFTIFKKFWEENKHDIPSVNSAAIMEEGLRRITNTEFTVKPETIFYEDTRLSVKNFWTENNWRPLRKKMTMLSRFLMPLTPSGHRDRLIDFYRKNFNESVSLWAFYQKWLPLSKVNQESENTQYHEIELNLNYKLATLPRSESLIHLTPNFLRSISSNHENSQPHFGSLVLPFQNAGQDQLYLDIFVAANARLSGRFLSLFPDSDRGAWYNFHQAQAGEKRWIENQDYSFFNANVHPPLISDLIQIPSVYVSGAEQGISILDIMVQLNKEEELILTYNNQVVEVINLSLEAIDNRSGLYQLLSQLEPTVPSKNLLLKSINYLQKPTDKGIFLYPRVIYDQQIILQRATWFFPKQTLPNKPKGSNNTVYRDLLLRWLKANKLPKQFYYTLSIDHRSIGENARRNQHKPQFFDIRNPLSIDLWHRDLKKVVHYLKIEEMLPLPEQLIEVDGVKRMVEALVMI